MADSPLHEEGEMINNLAHSISQEREKLIDFYIATQHNVSLPINYFDTKCKLSYLETMFFDRDKITCSM